MEDRWYLLGDIHGEYTPIQQFYETKKDILQFEQYNNYIILLGDVGANYYLRGQRDVKFKMALSEYPFTYICLRGNHESRVKPIFERKPQQWEMQQKYGGEIYVEKDFPKIEYLSDIPAVYEFNGYKTLSLPGAYSVDKMYRLANNWAWFPDEQLTEEEMEVGRQLKKKESPFDLVISHTCPLIYEPTDLFLFGIDQSSVDKTMERFLGEIEFDLDYKRWAFGHYHADRLYPWNDGKQMLMLLNENPVDLNRFMEMTKGDSLPDIKA